MHKTLGYKKVVFWGRNLGAATALFYAAKDPRIKAKGNTVGGTTLLMKEERFIPSAGRNTKKTTQKNVVIARNQS